MPENQDERSGAIVDDRGRFRTAQQREIVFEIDGTMSAFTGREIVFEVVVVARNGAEGFDDRLAERRTTEVGVNDDAGAVDERLDSCEAQVFKCIVEMH